MIKLTKNGKVKTVSDETYRLLKKNLQGWRLVAEEKKPFSEKTSNEQHKALEQQAIQKDAEQPIEQQKSNGPTREEMIKYLKDNGVSCNPRISDEKLTERYELEINA
jgi:hypothetical protein